MARDERSIDKGVREEHGRKLAPWLDLERKRGHWEGTERDVPSVGGDRRVWWGAFDADHPQRAVETALAHLDLDAEVRRGQAVWIKVRLGGGLGGAKGSFTDPELVRGLVRWVRAHGGRAVVCEADQPAFRARASLLKARGYESVLLDEGAEFANLSDGELARIQSRGLDVALDVPTALLDPAVLVINAFAPQYHWECGLALAHWNLHGAVGFATQGDRQRVGARLGEVVAASARLIRPAISVGGGRFFGAGLGPHFTVPVRIDRMVAFRDVVIGDRALCDVLGYPWRAVEYLALNAALGAGEGDPAYEPVSGSDPIPTELLERIRSHGLAPSVPASWKPWLRPRYYVPGIVQRSLCGAADGFAASLRG